MAFLGLTGFSENGKLRKSPHGSGNGSMTNHTDAHLPCSSTLADPTYRRLILLRGILRADIQADAGDGEHVTPGQPNLPCRTHLRCGRVMGSRKPGGIPGINRGLGPRPPTEVQHLPAALSTAWLHVGTWCTPVRFRRPRTSCGIPCTRGRAASQPPGSRICHAAPSTLPPMPRRAKCAARAGGGIHGTFRPAPVVSEQ